MVWTEGFAWLGTLIIRQGGSLAVEALFARVDWHWCPGMTWHLVEFGRGVTGTLLWSSWFFGSVIAFGRAFTNVLP